MNRGLLFAGLAWVAIGGAAGCGGSAVTSPPTDTPSPTAEQLAAAREAQLAPAPPLENLLSMDQAFQLARGVNETAADALGRIGPAAIPALTEALRDSDPLVRREAARAFARMGSDAAPAIPNLIEALKDPNEEVRRSAAQALGQIGPAAQAAIPALVEALRDHPESQAAANP